MKRISKSVKTALIVLIVLLVYAYGFDVTQVNLETARQPRRQESFVRILRALAHPDIITYEQSEVVVEAPILVGCPEGRVNFPEPDQSGPYMVITPPCADPKAEISVEGFNFAPNVSGPINFIPPSGVTIQLGNFQSDGSGHFQSTVILPNRQPIPETQTIRSITRANVGGPKLSRNGKDTWDKIIETVFLALLATTFGTIFAVPTSFLAAKNIMKDVVSPLSSVALSLIAWPIGIGVGWYTARGALLLSDLFGQTTLLLAAGVIITPLLTYFAMRIGLPPTDARKPTSLQRLGRFGALAAAALAGIVAALLISQVIIYFGENLGKVAPLEFLGSFFVSVSQMVSAFLGLVVALAAGGLLSSWAGNLGQWMTDKLSISWLKIANLVLAAIAGALIILLAAYALEWLYDFNNPVFVFVIPAILGALAGLLVAARLPHKGSLPVGLTIYTAVRAVLNVLRSIEAFIWAIIFVVLVSTGPFAGTLALTLHTIAALGKLFSEQVESIMPGPLEAIRATGATRLQTIIYGVIPQIIPPYISFTMYRWDTNVRMSTIIGFAGGGGIGFLLQQNINLLNYRAASTQMIAITAVVWAMDYISSVLRERFV